MSDLLALLVAVPILGALLTLVAGYTFERLGWGVALVTSLVHTAMAGTVAAQVYAGGEPLAYAVGGFRPPFGIELVVDGLNAAVVVLVAAVALGVLAYARRAGPHSPAFYTGYLLLVAGLSGMSVTGDMFNLYVFLEITGLAAYALVATGDDGRSAVGALKYLLVGTVGASLFLVGIGYAFVATGTLNMADLAEKLAGVGYGSTLVRASFAFVVTGLAVKTALYPLHTWQPEAYASAPDSVSALISALVSTVSAYALARVVYSVYTVDFLASVAYAREFVLVLAGVSIVAGSVLAVMQSELKRMLAYSSVSQFGLVVAAFAVANEAAVTGGLVHLVGHAVMKGGLFLAVGAVAARTGVRYVEQFDGLADRVPLLSAALATLSLSMVGVPPAVGFVGKWYIALGAIQAGSWPIAVVILLSTLLTLAYFLRLVERMYFRSAATTEPSADSPTGTGAAAVADGGNSGDVTDDERPVLGRGDDADFGRPSVGMVAVVVVAAVLAVGLGPLVSTFEPLLEPTLDLLLQP
ncbi:MULTISPECIES: monovalent cation/H+ antiporter subunit D family protein [Haloprofundus]|uniref:monovalent cation/H+ antiporter subunit D family protein n=1 Tax=Haloprofundus TaxID=1911573 RepID=UPI000E447879|nr:MULTISPECIES: monovalent cation/H+ antiporter subunit D family protein [Haloprofundus]QCJ47782.1 monovalent cation/H+ antiporter subunit D family protein [Haloprofundus sp. MHR1]